MTDTSPEAIAALCERLRAKKDSGMPRTGGGSVSTDGKSTWYMHPPIMVAVNPNGSEAAATIEALQAERDAALADETCPVCNGEMADPPTSGSFCPAGCRSGIVRQTSAQVLRNVRPFWLAEGARQERAAIVAWLGDASNSASSTRSEDVLRWVRMVIEAGDHVKASSAGGAGE